MEIVIYFSSMKNLLSILALLFLVCPLVGQQIIVDSLEAELESATIDTVRVKLLGDLAYSTFNSDPEKSMDYARRTLALAQEIDYAGGQVNGWYKMALANLAMSNLDSAAYQIENALQLALEVGNQSKVLGVYNLGGVIYHRKGDMEKAIDYIFESARISENLGDSLGAGTAYNNLGEIYDRKGDRELAHQFYYKSYKLGKATKDTLNWVASATNLSGIEADPVKRLFYLEEAMGLCEHANYTYGKAYALTGLANYYWEIENDKPAAIDYYRDAIFYSEKSGDQFNAMNIYIDIGDLFSQMGQADSARYYLAKGQALADTFSVEEQQIEARISLAHHFHRNKDFAKAYDYLYECMVLKDSLFNQNLATQMAESNTRYETEKKEAQIAEQELKIAREVNTRNLILFGALILMLTLAAIAQWYFNRQNLKKKEAELALEKELEEANRLRELDNLKTSFFTNISHELRTPLTLISGPLEDALSSKHKGSKEEDLQLAYNNSKRLLGLVNEIMDLSKLEAGKLEVHTHKLEPARECKRIFLAFESLAALKNVRLEYREDFPPDCWIQSDGKKIEKVLNNLVSNAIKHSPENSVVQMEARYHEGNLQVTLTDQGEGIPKNELPKIFDRFYQVNSGQASATGGTGIGLALSKELSHLLGGDLRVESTEGVGSKFFFSIPVDKTAAPAVKTTDQAEEKKIGSPENIETVLPVLINGEKARILIVEDNMEMSRYLHKILSSDYKCSIAPNGVEALKMLQKESFDLITSDVMMPLLDGFELRSRVNNMKKLRDIPYIFLTARALEEDRLKGLQLGVDDYITKPFNANELKVRIHNLLQNKVARSQAGGGKDENLTADQKLLQQARDLVMENLSRPQFKVPDLAGNLGMGERQLRRVMQRLTGLSPVNFILELRLQKARQLLEANKHFTVAEVMYEIGIESPSYFSRKFKQRFGRSPGEWVN